MEDCSDTVMALSIPRLKKSKWNTNNWENRNV